MKKIFIALAAIFLSATAFADKVVYSKLNKFDGGVFITFLENDKSEESARKAALSLYLYICSEAELSSSAKRNQEFKILKDSSSHSDTISRYLIAIRKFDNIRLAIASYSKNESSPYKVEVLEYSDGAYYSKSLPELYDQALDEIKTWIEDR